jgi:hypothetical protein
MTIRLHLFFAAMAAGLLCLPAPEAVGAEETPQISSAAGPVVAAQSSPAKVASRKTRARRIRKKDVKANRAFVLLNQRILDDALAGDSGSFAGIYDYAVIEQDALAAPEGPWGSGPFAAVAAWEGAPYIRIDIQPLDFNLGAFHPFVGDLFAPLIAGPLTTTADAVSFAQLSALGMDSFVAAGNAESEATGVDSPLPGGSASPFAYRYKMDKKTSVNAGVAWIKDLADTQGLAPIEEATGYGAVSSEAVSAVNFTLGASYRAFTLTGGYIRAVDTKIGPADLDLIGNQTEPVSWNSELAYSTELLRKETTLAVGYQKSSASLQLYLPEERWRTKAMVALFDSATLTLEYYQDREYANKDGVLEEEGYGVTTKIGFSF